MCKYCEVYGENGELWYFNPANHARQMYKLRKPGEGYKEFSSESHGATEISIVDIANDEPERLPEALKEYWDNRWSGDMLQVIPLQDAEKLVEMTSVFAAMSCVCRIRARGIVEDDPKKYSCGGLGVGMLKWERFPERYKGGVDFMSPDEAKEWLRKWNKRGMVHIIMNYGGSYIGGICNCDYPDCIPLRTRVDLGAGCLKSHYVCKVNYDMCTGCKDCVGRCFFNSLKYEVTTKKANIDLTRCFGCGLCQTACSQEAIELIPRSKFPAIANSW